MFDYSVEYTALLVNCWSFYTAFAIGSFWSPVVITKSWRLKDHSMWVFRKNSMEFSIGLDYLLILLLQVAVPY